MSLEIKKISQITLGKFGPMVFLAGIPSSQVGATAVKHGKITTTVIIQSCKMQMFPN
jgi:hypothetical protein